MSEWKEYRIGKLAEVTSSKRIFLSDYVAEGVPFYRSREIIEKHNGKEISLELFIKNDLYQAIKDKFGVPMKDDILLTSVGTIGVPYLVKANEVFYFKDGNLTWIRNYRKDVAPQFLYYWITSDLGQKTIQTSLIGSSQAALTIADIKKLKISLPLIGYQHRIASILSAYDDLIETNNRRIALLEQMAEQIYKEWFVRMRFPGWEQAEFEKGVPKGWGLMYFKDFIKLNRGFDLPEDKVFDGPYPVIASTSIKTFHNSYKVNPPCVTTGRSGSLGVVQYVNNKSWPLNTALYVKDFKGNSPRFVFYLLKSLKLENFNAGAGVPTLNQNHLHKLKLPVPTLEIQNRFDSLIIPMFDQMENLKNQNQILKQTRDLLLPRLISGKLKVKETLSD